MEKKRVIILGASGSIGRSTIDVIRNLNAQGEDFRITGLSCRSRIEELIPIAEEFSISQIAVTEAKTEDDRILFRGEGATLRLLEESEADIVVNGIAGSPGLEPSMKALELGMDLALANKETVVMAAPLAFAAARRSGAKILPVDSEHSALFHLLQNRESETIRRLHITASGGAFLRTPLEDFPRLKAEDALKHPTWDMGAKITIDSASMANKGLEVIEAHRLFDMEAQRISVLIHPQSTVHSMVETVEGSLYAQLSSPDMRIPIQNALTYPGIAASPFGLIDFTSLQLSFEEPEYLRYPMLSLAYDTIRREGPLPIVYNAANEVAVEAFRRELIPFTGISELVEECLRGEWPSNNPGELAGVLDLHRAAEKKARRIVYNGKDNR